MSAKPRTRPRDLILPVPLAGRPGAKARGLPRTVPAVRIPLGFSAISWTCWRSGWDSNPRYALRTALILLGLFSILDTEKFSIEAVFGLDFPSEESVTVR